MRISFIVAGLLLSSAPAVAADSTAEEAAAIRRRCEQYIAAVLTKDAAALGELLADSYSRRSFELPHADKQGAIAYFTEQRRTFSSFKNTGVLIRVIGDTAVETGEVDAWRTEFGHTAQWGKIPYSRVWLKRGGVWRILQEHLG
jgi:ketosteroid isomerase-like protein